MATNGTNGVKDSPWADDGPITKFPADGLRHARRFITGHNTKGQGVFVGDDDGAHHKVMARGRGVANIIYSTKENPVELSDDVDIDYAKSTEVSNPLQSKSVREIMLMSKHSRAFTFPTDQSAA